MVVNMPTSMGQITMGIIKLVQTDDRHQHKYQLHGYDSMKVLYYRNSILTTNVLPAKSTAHMCETGNAEEYEKAIRLYKLYCNNARSDRYLCHTCATQLACQHGYELKEAEKRKKDGTSDVLDK